HNALVRPRRTAGPWPLELDHGALVGHDLGQVGTPWSGGGEVDAERQRLVGEVEAGGRRLGAIGLGLAGKARRTEQGTRERQERDELAQPEGIDQPRGERYAGRGGERRTSPALELRQSRGQGAAAAGAPAEPPVGHQAAEAALEGPLGHAATGRAGWLAQKGGMRRSG